MNNLDRSPPALMASVGAKPQLAGHDDIRSQVSHQLRALKALVGVRNFLGCVRREFITSLGTDQTRRRFRRSSLREVLYAAAAPPPERNSSPVVIIAQAMRASLLATATVTSRAGRRCNKFRVHSATESVLFFSHRKLEVAPKTSNRLR
jgi:hypothetical protein